MSAIQSLGSLPPPARRCQRREADAWRGDTIALAVTHEGTHQQSPKVRLACRLHPSPTYS